MVPLEPHATPYGSARPVPAHTSFPAVLHATISFEVGVGDDDVAVARVEALEARIVEGVRCLTAHAPRERELVDTADERELLHALVVGVGDEQITCRIECCTARAVEPTGRRRRRRRGNLLQQLAALVEDLGTEIAEITNPHIVIAVDSDVAGAVLELTGSGAAIAAAGLDAIEVGDELSLAAGSTGWR